MKKIWKKIIFVIIIISFCSLTLILSKINIQASYNYNNKKEVITVPDSLSVTKVIDASNLLDINNHLVTEYQFGTIVDVFTKDKTIYISDSSNNKIIVLDEYFRLKQIIPSSSSVTLNKPLGLFVNDDYIYVADFGNNRIVLFDREGNFVKAILTPTDVVFKGYEFRPKKIAVSKVGRIYCVAEGINEGILEFGSDHVFTRFYGMNTATISKWQEFWQIFTTEEQRLKQGYNFGASLLNLCIDQDDYIYTVSSPIVRVNFIKKLNYKGSDVLIRNGYIHNDGDYITIDQKDNRSSTFVDIDVNEYGTYIALDKTRGRIFAYDFEGNLLYVADGKINTEKDVSNNQTKVFRMPEALCFFGDQVLVVDSQNKNLIVFEYSPFGKLINEATKYYYQNEYIKAAEVYSEVLKLNANYPLAYAGIGRAKFREGNIEEAIEYLKKGYDKYNYSLAYKEYRYMKLSKVAPFILSLSLIVVLGLLTRTFIKQSRNKEEE